MYLSWFFARLESCLSCSACYCSGNVAVFIFRR